MRAGIAMFAQIRGSNYLRLIPDYLCEMHCATIEFELKQGEICKYWVFVHFETKRSFKIGCKTLQNAAGAVLKNEVYS